MADEKIWRQAKTGPFRKASFSEGVGNCVEVAHFEGVAVRDSKDPEGPVLWYTRDEWTAFVMGVKAGEFDLD